jgi:hypothetical protein
MAEHERDGWFLERYDPVTIFQTRLNQRRMAQLKSADMFSNPPAVNFEVLD